MRPPPHPWTETARLVLGMIAYAAIVIGLGLLRGHASRPSITECQCVTDAGSN